MEEIRAKNRADAIVNSVRTMSSLGAKEIYELNLGQFQSTIPRSHIETADQRRVIVIGIMDKPSNMPVEVVGEKLRFAFQNSEQLNLEITMFSKYEFGKR